MGAKVIINVQKKLGVDNRNQKTDGKNNLQKQFSTMKYQSYAYKKDN